MEYSMAPVKERHKLQSLVKVFDKKALDCPVKIEIYDRDEVIPAEIVRRYDMDVVKYFLIRSSETFKAGYLQYLWEAELSRWIWGSKELNIEP